MSRFNQDTTGVEIVQALKENIKGRTVLITGPSDGTIGGQTALDLAVGSSAHIILAGRNITKIQPVIDQIKTEHPSVTTTFVKLDLADNASVKAAAEDINGKIDKLDALINNAGVMAVKAYTKSADNIELQFAANHIGHFLLTNLLLPKIVAAKGRVVNVSSQGYMCGGIAWEDVNFHDGKTYNPWLAYSQSKTANILFAKALAAKLSSKGVLAFSVSPGLVLESKLQADLTMEDFGEGKAIAEAALGKDFQMPESALRPKPLVAGGATSIYAAFAPDLSEHPGAFLVDAQVWTEPLLPHATSQVDAEKLWTLSEKLVGQKFDI